MSGTHTPNTTAMAHFGLSFFVVVVVIVIFNFISLLERKYFVFEIEIVSIYFYLALFTQCRRSYDGVGALHEISRIEDVATNAEMIYKGKEQRHYAQLVETHLRKPIVRSNHNHIRLTLERSDFVRMSQTLS